MLPLNMSEFTRGPDCSVPPPAPKTLARPFLPTPIPQPPLDSGCESIDRLDQQPLPPASFRTFSERNASLKMALMSPPKTDDCPHCVKLRAASGHLTSKKHSVTIVETPKYAKIEPKEAHVFWAGKRLDGLELAGVHPGKSASVHALCSAAPHRSILR